MKKLAKAIVTILFASALGNVQAQEWSWLAQAESEQGATFIRMAVDSEGNSYSIASMMGAYGNISGEDVTNLASLFTPHISKHDAAGNLLWTEPIGVNVMGINGVNGIVVDSNDNVYFGYEIVLFGADTWEFEFRGTTITPLSNSTFMLFKVNPQGELEWYRAIADPGEVEGAIVVSRGLSIDDNDNIYFAAQQHNGPVSYGEYEFTAPGGDNILGQMNTEGEVQWAKQLGTEDGAELNLQMAALQGGGVVASSTWYGETLEVDGLTLTNPDALVGSNEDRFIVKFDETGEIQFLIREGGPEPDSDGFVCGTSDGGVMVLSPCYYAISLGGVEISAESQSLTRYDSSGNLLWAKEFGNKTLPYDIKRRSNSSGDSYLLAFSYTGETLDLNGEIIQNAGGIAGTSDAMLVEIDGQGEVLWRMHTSGVDNEDIYRVVIDQDDVVYACGSFNSESLYLEPITLTNNQPLINNGFIGRMESSTRINESLPAEEIALYPNPARNHLVVDLSSVPENAQLMITDAQGRQVLSVNRTGNEQQQIDVSALKAGMYLLSVLSGDQVRTAKFFIE